jgi:GNAT superfamily N-acetyltransferase
LRDAARTKLRKPEPAEAEALTAIVQRGFETYRAFAPEGWEPPDESERLERNRAELASPEVFALAAYVDGAPVGHTRVVPIAEDPTDVRLRYLFVDAGYWGTGLARELHAAAVEAIGTRSARLFTPQGQARARRFYEREGWTLHADGVDAHFGLPLAEYRRGMGG